MSFKFPDGSWRKRAFTYDFRIWSVSEIVDSMKEAGFRNIHVWIGEQDNANDEEEDYDVYSIKGESNSKAFIRIEAMNYKPKSDTWDVYIAGMAPFSC
jgi:hypothetical protein